MKTLGGLAILTVLGIVVAGVAPATAATIVKTGAYPATASFGDSASAALGPGRYRFSLAFTRPVSDVEAQATKSTVTEFYCEDPATPGEFACGGDDVPTVADFAIVTPTLYQAALTVDAPYTILAPGSFFVRTETFETCCDFVYNFTSGEAGSYTLSYAVVPEPGAWAMMIAGAGAVGGSLRRRARPVVPRPAA